MTTLILSFIFLLLVVGFMAVGVLFGRKPIKGSCGGMQQLGLKGDCDICGGNLEACEEQSKLSNKSSEVQSKDTSFYEAK